MNLKVIVILFAVVLVMGSVVCARVGHTHEPYSQWRKPDNPAVSCCSNADCRPTRAYPGEDGLWRAWIGGRWITVPPEVMLPADYAGDGRSHVCEKDGYFYCFTPGEIRG